ncbi:DUF7524 family protein [Salinigranum sp. GCM10025319]|uniref:DUF7524 family protein n=1 Tax=Salinigranum sp. GCM10025319 TaxID=3252687 RepID=UPI00361E87E0
MPATLPVDLNRERLHAVEAPVEFATDGSFRVELSNHGEGVHVHLHLDDDLSAVARIENGNVFVAGDTATTVDVAVDDPPTSPITGKLKVSTGYGAETTYVDVTVEPFEEQTRQVAVDESLSKPPQHEPSKAVPRPPARRATRSGRAPLRRLRPRRGRHRGRCRALRRPR